MGNALNMDLGVNMVKKGRSPATRPQCKAVLILGKKKEICGMPLDAKYECPEHGKDIK